jgi:8-oxo-dGTP diphosphatase
VGIRTAAKAIIIQNGQLLAIKKRDDQGDYYILPGGGQEYGETLDAAVKRECLEEVGMEVEVGHLVFVRDYIAKNHMFASDEKHLQLHQVELMFLCTVKSESETHEATQPDDGQIGVEWLPLETIGDVRLYPQAMLPYLQNWNGRDASYPIYLGDVD